MHSKMCNEWDGGARAVIPSESIKKAEHPMEATPEIALESEYAFGVGINIVEFNDNSSSEGSWTSDEADDEYYVSWKASQGRPDVRPGWCVVAQPGKWFEIVVSPLRGIQSVQRTIGKKGNLVTGGLMCRGGGRIMG